MAGPKQSNFLSDVALLAFCLCVVWILYSAIAPEDWPLNLFNSEAERVLIEERRRAHADSTTHYPDTVPFRQGMTLMPGQTAVVEIGIPVTFGSDSTGTDSVIHRLPTGGLVTSWEDSAATEEGFFDRPAGGFFTSPRPGPGVSLRDRQGNVINWERPMNLTNADREWVEEAIAADRAKAQAAAAPTYKVLLLDADPDSIYRRVLDWPAGHPLPRIGEFLSLSETEGADVSIVDSRIVRSVTHFGAAAAGEIMVAIQVEDVTKGAQ